MSRIFIFFLFNVFAISVFAGGSKRVEVQTNVGVMEFELYDDTPLHRDAFLKLAGENYFDGTLFYRVISDYLIQGGSRSSRNAPAGARIGYGSPDHTVDDEIRANHFHRRGALCAPRQDDAVNPFKQSDISQFYVVQGSVRRQGELDTLELSVNIPIKKRVTAAVYTEEVRERLKRLKKEASEATDVDVARAKTEEFRALAENVKQEIQTQIELDRNFLRFTDEERLVYSTEGGYPELDGKYTVFGECVRGFDVLKRISGVGVDGNARPLKDVVIIDVVVK
ncbi:MAG: peptidylprolyl isomerase [Mangrovibacterium sp.]